MIIAIHSQQACIQVFASKCIGPHIRLGIVKANIDPNVGILGGYLNCGRYAALGDLAFTIRPLWPSNDHSDR